MTLPAIADSSALVSLATDTDSNHNRAIDISRLIKADEISIIIPGDIFTETINVLGKKADHQTAVGAAEAITNSKEFVIAEATENIRNRALDIFKNQPASVSFTDCLVMAFADHYHTKQIFGFDEIFRKNKYERLGLDKI